MKNRLKCLLDLAREHRQAGRLYSEQMEFERSAEAFLEEAKLREEALALDPKRLKSARLLAETYHAVAAVLLWAEKPGESARYLICAYALYSKLLELGGKVTHPGTLTDLRSEFDHYTLSNDETEKILAEEVERYDAILPPPKGQLSPGRFTLIGPRREALRMRGILADIHSGERKGSREDARRVLHMLVDFSMQNCATPEGYAKGVKLWDEIEAEARGLVGEDELIRCLDKLSDGYMAGFLRDDRMSAEDLLGVTVIAASLGYYEAKRGNFDEAIEAYCLPPQNMCENSVAGALAPWLIQVWTERTRHVADALEEAGADKAAQAYRDVLEATVGVYAPEPEPEEEAVTLQSVMQKLEDRLKEGSATLHPAGMYSLAEKDIAPLDGAGQASAFYARYLAEAEEYCLELQGMRAGELARDVLAGAQVACGAHLLRAGHRDDGLRLMQQAAHVYGGEIADCGGGVNALPSILTKIARALLDHDRHDDAGRAYSRRALTALLAVCRREDARREAIRDHAETAMCLGYRMISYTEDAAECFAAGARMLEGIPAKHAADRRRFLKGYFNDAFDLIERCATPSLSERMHSFAAALGAVDSSYHALLSEGKQRRFTRERVLTARWLITQGRLGAALNCLDMLCGLHCEQARIEDYALAYDALAEAFRENGDAAKAARCAESAARVRERLNGKYNT